MCITCPRKDTNTLRRTTEQREAGEGGICVVPSSCFDETYAGLASPESTQRECLPCTTCTLNVTYEVSPCSYSANRICKAVQEPCASDEFEDAAPTMTSDRVCKPCVTCPVGTQTDSALGKKNTCATSLAYDCVPCDGRLEYQDLEGQLKCKFQPECISGQMVVLPGGPSVLKQCRPCNDDEYDHDYRASSACQPKTKCNTYMSLQPGFAEWESDFGSTTSDRECDPVTFCTDGEEFETAAPTPTANRECQKFLECDFFEIEFNRGSQYEVFGGDGFKDKSCETLTECTAPDIYEVIMPGACMHTFLLLLLLLLLLCACVCAGVMVRV